MLGYNDLLQRVSNIPKNWKIENNKIVHEEITDLFNQPAEILVALAYHETGDKYSNGMGDVKQICYDVGINYKPAEIMYFASSNLIFNSEKRKKEMQNMLILITEPIIT